MLRRLLLAPALFSLLAALSSFRFAPQAWAGPEVALTTTGPAAAEATDAANTPAAEKPKQLPPFKESVLMGEETKLVLQLLSQVHYLNAQVKNTNIEELITEYMGDLDNERLFFTANDRKVFLKEFGPTLIKDLTEKGNLDAAFRIFEVYRQRVTDRANWVFEELKKDFDFTTDESYARDRDKGPWPATREEADQLWRVRLKFELIPDLLNGKTIEEAKETVHKRYERMVKSVDEVEAGGIQEIFLSTLTRLYDPHSTFFSAETAEDFNISMRLSLVGIGALLASEDGYCVIKELVAGGPAMLSKQIKPNDKIIAVAQANEEPVDVIGMNLRKVVQMIRGEKGTPITLTIIPADSTDNAIHHTVTLVRDVVQLNANRAKASVEQVPTREGGTIPLGVIDVPSFYGPMSDDDPTSVTADVEELIGKLKEAKVRGIILDLRRNGGGLLSEAVDMTGLFISKGPVVQVRDQFGQVSWKSDTNPKVAYDGPLLVLTSRYSASASEIVAGALQNYGRAIIVGDSSTHGKGTVQAVLYTNAFIPARIVGDAQTGAAKLTVQKFYLPNGSSTQNKGVIPDISLPAIEDYLPIGEADLPNSLSWDEIGALRFNGHPLNPELRDYLKDAALERVATLDEFDYLKKRIAWQREREEMKSIPVNLEERRQMKEEEERIRKEMKERQKMLSASNYPSQEVLLDSVIETRAKNPPETEAEPQPDSESQPTPDAQPAPEVQPGAPEIEPESGTQPDLATPPPAAEPGSEAAPKDTPQDKAGEDEDEESIDDEEIFDVRLRESLRILRDAIAIAPDPSTWGQEIPTIAAHTADHAKEAATRRN